MVVVKETSWTTPKSPLQMSPINVWQVRHYLYHAIAALGQSPLLYWPWRWFQEQYA